VYDNTATRPGIIKTVGVIDAPGFLKFTGDSEAYSGNRLRVVPVVFTADRNLMGRTLEIESEDGRKAVALFEDAENLIQYVPEVNVNLYKSSMVGLNLLLARPSILVIDKNLAEALRVEIGESGSQKVRIAEVLRGPEIFQKEHV
jgi:hypothetical protein